MRRFNFHSHSTFCDGKSTMEEMVQAALESGMEMFGFSAHAPVPFPNRFALKEEDSGAYIAEAKRLKDKYRGQIELSLGMELDYIPDIMENDRERAEKYSLDYFIGSVHQVKEHNNSTDMWFIDGHDPEPYDRGLQEIFGGDVRRAVKAFFHQQNEMIEKNSPDIIGHMDKVLMHNRGRFFSQDEQWYKNLFRESVQLMKEKDIICEINTRGLYKKRHDDFYPSARWFKYLNEQGIRLTISTDCHMADEVSLYYDEALLSLKDAGVKQLWYFSKGTFHAEGIE